MENLLSFDNKNKKNVFCFVFCSLIRNFVGNNKTKGVRWRAEIKQIVTNRTF